MQRLILIGGIWIRRIDIPFAARLGRDDARQQRIDPGREAAG